MIDHISDLILDPKNARSHSARNIGMLVNALHDVGAARSIVIDENNVVLAGNATCEAAAEAGIENVRVIEANGEEIIAVRRTGLTEEQKTKLAIYDNRVAELADWDPSVLADLNLTTDLKGFFFPDELCAILAKADAFEPPGGNPGDPNFDPASQVDQSRLDQRATVQCPECGHEFTPPT